MIISFQFFLWDTNFLPRNNLDILKYILNLPVLSGCFERSEGGGIEL
jgi:hypothetical protein